MILDIKSTELNPGLFLFGQGFHGKTIDFAACSPCHWTTVAHFLNRGRWNVARLEELLKDTVARIIYKEACDSGKPVFCITDDTISSKTKPLPWALHPIEDAYFHQSHFKRRQNMSGFALCLRKTDADVSLMTAGRRQYYVYRYEDSSNGMGNFRQSKGKLVFSQCQIRASAGILRRK